MTARIFAPALMLVMALAWSVAFACPGDEDSHSGYKSAAEHNTAVAGYSETRPSADTELSFSDGEWSGGWVAGEWTPGYWADGSWHAAELINGQWVVSDDGADFTLTPSAWAALPQGRSYAYTSASLADLNRERLAEYDNIYSEGAVMGYSDRRHDADIYMEGDMHAGAKGHMYEGAKCGHHTGAERGYRGGGHGCGCVVERKGCYDCWGVWQTDDMYDFAAIRESDYDPVMGRGDTGRGWFW